MALERNMTILRRMNEILLGLNTLTLMIIINNKESRSSIGCSSNPFLFEVENHVSAVSAGAAIWIAYERRFVRGLLFGWVERPKPFIFVPHSDKSLLLKILFENVQKRFTSSSEEVLLNRSDLRPVRLLGENNSKDALQKHLRPRENILFSLVLSRKFIAFLNYTLIHNSRNTYLEIATPRETRCCTKVKPHS